MSAARVGRGCIGKIAASILFLALGPGLASQSTAGEDNFHILRGVATGGIWLELAYDAAGEAELAILDGLPGAPPETRFIKLEPVPGASCALEGEGGRIRVTPCPNTSGKTFSIKIGNLDATAVLAPISTQTSFAWPADVDFAGTRSKCLMSNLTQFAPINGSPLAATVQGISREASGISAKLNDGQQGLVALRSERLRLYSLIAFSPEEARRNQELADAIAGRPVLGRSMSLSEAAQMRERFDRDVLQNPARLEARLKLQQVDHSLGEIYNVQALNESANHLNRLTQIAPELFSSLDATLQARIPRSLEDAVAFEGIAGEIDQCLTAIGQGRGAAARIAVQKALAKRADELAQTVLASVRGAASADAAKSALAPFETNATITKALADGGKGQLLAEARSIVAGRFAAEDRALAAADRQARVDASRNQVPIGGGGGLNVSAVQNSVYFIFTRTPAGGFRGSGVAVSDRHIVTNVHVVEGATEVRVVRNGQDLRKNAKVARILKLYPSDDLAILEVDGLGAARAPVATGDPPQGSGIWVLGFPGMADNALDEGETLEIASISNGIVARVIDGVTGDEQQISRLIQHSANTGSGSSGSAIFDACNRVVGIHNSAMLGEHSDRQPTGISSSVLATYLKQLGIPANFSSGRCGK